MHDPPKPGAAPNQGHKKPAPFGGSSAQNLGPRPKKDCRFGANCKKKDSCPFNHPPVAGNPAQFGGLGNAAPTNPAGPGGSSFPSNSPF